jgi:hypothetical protein
MKVLMEVELFSRLPIRIEVGIGLFGLGGSGVFVLLKLH